MKHILLPLLATSSLLGCNFGGGGGGGNKLAVSSVSSITESSLSSGVSSFDTGSSNSYSSAMDSSSQEPPSSMAQSTSSVIHSSSVPAEAQNLELIVSVTPALVAMFGGAEVSFTQRSSDITVTAIVNDAAHITLTVPAHYVPEEPAEITLTQGVAILKVLTHKLSLYQAMSARMASMNTSVIPQSATADDRQGLVMVSPASTAQFAYLDSDQNGRLSDDELAQSTTRLNSAEDAGLLLVSAAIEIFVTEDEVSGTQKRDSYQLALDMYADSQLRHFIKVQNYDDLKTIIDRDYPETITLAARNPETDDFFRVDENGALLEDQNTAFDALPWRCIDDLRGRSAPYRQYGYGIHMWHYGDSNTATTAVAKSELAGETAQFNEAALCGVTGWSIPTIEDFEFILDDQASKKVARFPLSFPFLDQRYYWVNTDNTRLTYSPGIYDLTIGQVIEAPELTRAAPLYKSWTRINADPLNPPAEQTSSDIAQIYDDIKSLYAERNPLTWPQPHIDDNIDWQPLGLLPIVEYPEDNPYSEDAKELGKRLFFDARLSLHRNIACATCHSPAQGWDDNLLASVGDAAQVGMRNAPSIINIAQHSSFFWDGRAATLEEQALGPIVNPVEMNLSLRELTQRIENGDFNDYKGLVKSAYNEEALSPEIIAKAMANYQRTIVSTNTKFDQFLRNERSLTNRELWGLHLFRTKARCMNCHFGPNFTSGGFEDLGLSDYNRNNQDLGRYTVTLKPEDVGKFKVSSLRELLHTAPYMHTGRFDFDELFTSYNNAMGVRNISNKLKINEYRYDPMFPVGSSKLQVLNLTDAEIEALKSFVETLSSRAPPLE
ncbi:cytochrome-c peroxidase [Marinagarivorans algicola]|uniref:cytochrome-c peroxidase n=1 Tax=Marinagarivorans algicola TaxID=1513270 RepID=UPI0006B59F34|nr:cytochrome c peroxidase [Marinagarivorans algicola]